MMFRWGSGEAQVRLKSQKYSELDIGGRETFCVLCVWSICCHRSIPRLHEAMLPSPVWQYRGDKSELEILRSHSAVAHWWVPIYTCMYNQTLFHYPHIKSKTEGCFDHKLIKHFYLRFKKCDTPFLYSRLSFTKSDQP